MLYYGLTQLGIFHTLVGVVAVVSGAVTLVREGEISRKTGAGKLYVYSTLVVCITGFGIFQHGGFGKPHALGVLTLITLALIFAVERGLIFQTWGRYAITVGYSLTFFFNIIPTIAEGATRLPYGAPLASSPEDPAVQMATGIALLLFLIGAALQVKKMKRASRAANP